MKLFFTGPFTENARRMIRSLGYGEIVNRSGVVSYTRRLAGAPFPRFHVYIDQTDTGFRVNMHLDQKAACYDDHTAHSGEYEGDIVAQEAVRITAHVQTFAENKKEEEGESPKTSLRFG